MIDAETLATAWRLNMLTALDQLRSAVDSGTVEMLSCVAINEHGEPVIYGPMPSANEDRLRLGASLYKAAIAVSDWVPMTRIG